MRSNATLDDAAATSPSTSSLRAGSPSKQPSVLEYSGPTGVLQGSVPAPGIGWDLPRPPARRAQRRAQFFTESVLAALLLAFAAGFTAGAAAFIHSAAHLREVSLLEHASGCALTDSGRYAICPSVPPCVDADVENVSEVPMKLIVWGTGR